MTAPASPPTELRVADLVTDPRRRRKATAFKSFVIFNAGLSIAISAGIVFSVFVDGVQFFVDVPKHELWGIGWFPRRGLYDIKTLVAGTLVVTVIAMGVAIPLGLGSAIYLSEFASARLRRVVKPVLEILAGVPSVVLGYFAIYFITPELLTRINGEVTFFNLGSAGVAVGILTIPLIASVSEDAMRAVPHSLREAAYGLGSRRLAVAMRVVFPAAISGVVAAIVIGFSRAIGETMVVAIAAGATGGSLFSVDPFSQGQTMTAAMAALGAGTDQVKGDDLASNSLFFVGSLLFLITLGLNLIGERFVRRVRERY
jgi:phosphate transport system permease protein